MNYRKFKTFEKAFLTVFKSLVKMQSQERRAEALEMLLNETHDLYPHEGGLIAIHKSQKVLPCLVAHLDTIPVLNNSTILSYARPMLWGNKIDGNDVSRTGIGADDLTGVVINLFLSDCMEAHLIFPFDEETGIVGSRKLAPELKRRNFHNLFTIMSQPDRRGNNEIIQRTNGEQVLSKGKTKSLVKTIAKKYGYKFGNGTATDIGELGPKCGVQSFNIACGYYGAHTENERQNVKEAHTCFRLLLDLLPKVKKELWTAPKKSYIGYQQYGKGWSKPIDKKSKNTYTQHKYASFMCGHCYTDFPAHVRGEESAYCGDCMEVKPPHLILNSTNF